MLRIERFRNHGDRRRGTRRRCRHALRANDGSARRCQARRHLFERDGCYLCHNYQGQGTGSRKPGQNPGPNLAPDPMPYAAYMKQLRSPRLAMPSYDAHFLSNQDAADIYAYLASQPPTKDASTIAVLNVVNAGTGRAPHGAVRLLANCASCHGASGQGGIGPSLKGESARKDAGAVAAFVKNPPRNDAQTLSGHSQRNRRQRGCRLRRVPALRTEPPACTLIRERRSSPAWARSARPPHSEAQRWRRLPGTHAHRRASPLEPAQLRRRFGARILPMFPKPLADWTAERSIADMDASGIAMAMLSMPATPGVFYGDAPAARKLSRSSNEYMASLKRSISGTLRNVRGVADARRRGQPREIAYACDQLKSDGIGLSPATPAVLGRSHVRTGLGRARPPQGARLRSSGRQRVLQSPPAVLRRSCDRVRYRHDAHYRESRIQRLSHAFRTCA